MTPDTDNNLLFWFLSFNSVLAAIALLAGLAAVYFGYKLFEKGHGAASDKASIKFGQLTISVTTVGTCVIGMSLPWGVIGYSIAPTDYAAGGANPLRIGAIPPAETGKVRKFVSNDDENENLQKFEEAVAELKGQNVNYNDIELEIKKYISKFDDRKKPTLHRIYMKEYTDNKSINILLNYNGKPVSVLANQKEDDWVASVYFGDWFTVIQNPTSLDELLDNAIKLSAQVDRQYGGIPPAGWEKADPAFGFGLGGKESGKFRFPVMNLP